MSIKDKIKKSKINLYNYEDFEKIDDDNQFEIANWKNQNEMVALNYIYIDLNITEERIQEYIEEVEIMASITVRHPSHINQFYGIAGDEKEH
ncbi:3986_t:CDS:2, partial [Cetraspora pellucida]